MHLPVGERIFRPADHPIDIGAIFDGDRLVEDIAFNLRARIEVDMDAANWPDHPAADEYLFGNKFALNKPVHVDDTGFGANRAIDRAINMQFSGSRNIALNGHILGNN